MAVVTTGGNADVYVVAPLAPAVPNDNAFPSLRGTLRIQAQERDWAASAREATDKLNEDAEVTSKTAASTIEALLYELRCGLSCLADEGTRNRLRCCDETAMRTIAAELLSWKDRNKPWLPPWLEEDVAKLVAVWEALK